MDTPFVCSHERYWPTHRQSFLQIIRLDDLLADSWWLSVLCETDFYGLFNKRTCTMRNICEGDKNITIVLQRLFNLLRFFYFFLFFSKFYLKIEAFTNNWPFQVFNLDMCPQLGSHRRQNYLCLMRPITDQNQWLSCQKKN